MPLKPLRKALYDLVALCPSKGSFFNLALEAGDDRKDAERRTVEYTQALNGAIDALGGEEQEERALQMLAFLLSAAPDFSPPGARAAVIARFELAKKAATDFIRQMGSLNGRAVALPPSPGEKLKCGLCRQDHDDPRECEIIKYRALMKLLTDANDKPGSCPACKTRVT